MNQLQSLIHDALIATGHVSQCAILRKKDGNPIATSVGFQVITRKNLLAKGWPHRLEKSVATRSYIPFQSFSVSKISELLDSQVW